MQKLAAALRDDSHQGVRCHAAWTLGKLGPRAGAAVPALTAALLDVRRSVRSRAAGALGATGAAATKLDQLSEAGGLVEVCLADSDPATRGHAVQSLKGLRDDAIGPAVTPFPSSFLFFHTIF